MILTDIEIQTLFSEEKTLPRDYQQKIKTKPKAGLKHEERELTIQGKAGHTYAMILRRNRIDFLDFSVILRYKCNESGAWYNIARYNGKHGHTNAIEGNSFYDFHTHLATQRYQEVGLRIESFAKINNTYKTYDEAVKAFIKDLNIHVEMPESTKALTEFGGV